MQNDRASYIVPLERLRARCNPASFAFATTESLPPPRRMVGQERAAEALEFGMGIPDNHYHIYVAGVPGSGRNIATEDAVKRIAATLPTPDDWCYVNNFKNQYAPRPLALPAGRAQPFANEMDTLIESVQQTMREGFDSDLYRQRRSAAMSPTDTERDGIIARLNEAALERNFVINLSEKDPEFLPLQPATEPGAERKPYEREDFEALSEAQQSAINDDYVAVQRLFVEAMTAARRLSLRARAVLVKLNHDFASEVIAPLFEAVRAHYADVPAVLAYLGEVNEDIAANAERVINSNDNSNDDSDSNNAPDASDPSALVVASPSILARYRINVLVDRTGQQGAPFINEHNPTYYNVNGRLEFGQRMGSTYTDFSFIRPGALHQANGGFLLIHIKELGPNPRSWDAVKRALRSGQITIENLTDPNLQLITASLKPEPIPLTIKIILLGDFGAWDALNSEDPDFSELFKVRVDFDNEMPRNPNTELFYAQFAGDVARAMKLPPLDPGAVARLVEEGSRMTENQTRLSSVLTDLRDLVIEAGYWARNGQVATITATQMNQAVLTRRRRTGLLYDRTLETVRQGIQMIATSGSAVGQINALSVTNILDTDIPRVMRVTARVAPGVEGVTTIEREAKLSGPLHTKGVLILAGFLTGQYGQDEPLSLSATLSFEQTYEGVDGDSASLAELCALMSALSEVPINQSLGITGSVNQWGEVQPIGSVTQKIEGFFATCQANGQTSDGQGVIIPRSNLRSLMLNFDVLQAVEAGRFTIYAVSHVYEAIDLLMNRPAGKRGHDGAYLSGTVNALVSEKLHLYADRVRRYRG
jgi:predicted ATP-dependent protease